MRPISFLVAAFAYTGIAPAAADVLYQMCGVDIVGHDASSFPAPNPDACAFLAPNVGECATWTDYNGGTCWLKKGCGQIFTTTPNAGAMSVVRFAQEPNNHLANFQAHADMPGFDIGSAPGNLLSDCYTACDANPKCFAYVWTDYNGGTCWLKSRASAFVPKQGAMAHVFARQAGALAACPRL